MYILNFELFSPIQTVTIAIALFFWVYRYVYKKTNFFHHRRGHGISWTTSVTYIHEYYPRTMEKIKVFFPFLKSGQLQTHCSFVKLWRRTKKKKFSSWHFSFKKTPFTSYFYLLNKEKKTNNITFFLIMRFVTKKNKKKKSTL